jgi:Tfp pilus assembly protein PilX
MKGKRSQHGSVIILVLLLLVLMFTMGMTILGMKMTQARSSMMMKQALIAKQIAISGIEDARLKLLKDIDFPPRGGNDDVLYSYSEILQFPGDSEPVGEFTVTVDSSCNEPEKPSNYDRKVTITSVGIMKDKAGQVAARHRITAILDTSAKSRCGPSDNPYLYRIVDMRDCGNI